MRNQAVRFIADKLFYWVCWALLTACFAATAQAGTAGADICANGEAIAGVGTYGFDNAAATRDGPGHAACVEFGQPNIDRDVWFCWLSDCTGEVTIETCGQTGVDTKIAVYDGCTCPPGDANLLDCDDDGCGLQSSVKFAAVSGAGYLIRVGSTPGGSGGVGTFSVTCEDLGNDLCNGADAIAGDGVFAFDNATANQDGPEHAGCSKFGLPQIAHDVWFCWEAGGDGAVSVESCGQTSVDTKIAVYGGCACPPSDANLLACNDDGCGLQSHVDFAAETGNSYLIRVGTSPGATGGSGAFTITGSGQDIPAVSSWGMIALMLMVLVSATIVLRSGAHT